MTRPLFACGCSTEGTYCVRHEVYWCHTNPASLMVPRNAQECPVCFLARLRSVSLSSAATPTRGKA